MKTYRKFPVVVSENGVSAKIRKVVQSKNGKDYTLFVVDYFRLGKRKQESRSDFDEAHTLAKLVCREIASGEQLAVTLTNGDRMAYLRAGEALNSIGLPIDVACQQYAEAISVLAGRVSIVEACREWAKRHSTALPRISVAAAAEQLKEQVKTDRKSHRRQMQISSVLTPFATAFNCEVHTLTPGLIAGYLAALDFAERTKRNHRDVLGYFFRWLVTRGYLPRGTDLLEGVQNYTARKIGEIGIYTPDEMARLLSVADERLVPFLAIGAFAGMRSAEIARLDWSEIDLDDTEAFIEVKACKSKVDMRRIVPVRDNLKAWLKPYRKDSGTVCPFVNIAKQIDWLVKDVNKKLPENAKLAWKHNGLRHSCISYRVAECADVPRVADESGNSVQVIRTNYLKRVRPTVAARWFNIRPASTEPVVASAPEQLQAAA